MACYTGLGLALARMLWTRGPTRLIALAVALTAAEWLRGHLFSGFPWNVYGYALTGPLVLAQSAALIGIWVSPLSRWRCSQARRCSPTIAPTRGDRGCRSRLG